MNCLLIAATVKEISPFLEKFRNNELTLFKKITIDIVITGIGLTCTTYHLVTQLYVKKPDLIIQAGVAGCFDFNIPLGAVVAIRQEAIADESVVELKKLKTLFDLRLIPREKFPYKNGWLLNPGNALLKKTKLKLVKGITVNQISTDKKMIQFYRDYFTPATESMEGAALHYVGLMENIPFLQIRSVSNYIGERNRTKWNMKESILNLNNELLRLFELI